MADWFDEEAELAKKAEENKEEYLNDILKDFSIDTNKEEKEVEDDREVYLSKDGFVIIPIIRGWFEILPLINIIKNNNLDSFIMGGYVRWMASKNHAPVPAGDCDIYSKTEESFNSFVEILKETHKMSVKHENDVSMTFANAENANHPLFACPTIQLIKPIKKGAIVAVGTMEEILASFDFTVIRCGVVSYDPPMAMVDADFEHDEGKRMLRIKNIHCPISSTMRCMKYAKKGYWIPPMHVLPLFLDWEQRDQNYRDKLVDYLQKANKGAGLTEEQVNELESLLMID